MTNRGERPEQTSGAPSEFPKNFLMPWMLLLLRNWSMHGYQLMQTLGVFGLATFDLPTVYRTLRRLEKDGLVMSDWQAGDTGPAKRVYSLTEAGEDFLRIWASTLEGYQRILDRFIEVYAEEKPSAPKEAPGSDRVKTERRRSGTMRE